MALSESGFEQAERDNVQTCMHVGSDSWTKNDMDCLLDRLAQVTCFTADLRLIAEHLGRSPEAVGRRLSKIGWSSPFHKHRRGMP